MADFTLSQISGPSTSGPSPTPAVQEPSTLGSIAGGLAQIFSAGMAQSGSLAAQRRYEQEQAVKSQGHKVVSRFTQQQLEIADAVDRGELSSQQARRQMRVNLARALADNPGFEEDIRAAHGDVLGTSGMGKVVATGTQAEQQFWEVQGEAESAGWITPDMGDDERYEATLDFMAFNRTQKELQAQQNELALKRSQLGYSTDQIQHETAKIRQSNARLSNKSQRLAIQQQEDAIAGQKNLGALNQSYFPQFQRKLDQIVNNESLPVEDKNRALDDIEQDYLNLSAQIGANAPSSFRDGMASPYRTAIANARAVVSGKRDLEAYNNQANIAKAKANLTLTGDPEVLQAMTLADAFPQAPEVQLAISPVVIRKIGELGNTGKRNKPIDFTDPDESETNKKALSHMKANMAALSSQSGDITPQQKETVSGGINRILRGVNAFGASVDDPGQLNDLVDFFASDEYGNYVSSEGTGIDPENVRQAEEVIQAEYTNVVQPLIRKEYSDVTARVGVLPGDPNEAGGVMAVADERPVASLIEPIWTGSGLTFRTNSDQANVRAKTRQLNKRVAPIVTKLVKVGAHFSGTKNYESVYNDQFAQLFGQSDETTSE